MDPVSGKVIRISEAGQQQPPPLNYRQPLQVLACVCVLLCVCVCAHLLLPLRGDIVVVR